MSHGFSDDAERAPETVSARIRETLRHLQQRHLEPAKRLRASVSTGSTCRYRPPEGIPWTYEGELARGQILPEMTRQATSAGLRLAPEPP